MSFVKRYLYYHGYSQFCLGEYYFEFHSNNDISKSQIYSKVHFLSGKNVAEGISVVKEQFAEYLLFIGTKGGSEEDLVTLHQNYEPYRRVLTTSCVSLSNHDVYSALLSLQLGHE